MSDVTLDEIADVVCAEYRVWFDQLGDSPSYARPCRAGITPKTARARDAYAYLAHRHTPHKPAEICAAVGITDAGFVKLADERVREGLRVNKTVQKHITRLEEVIDRIHEERVRKREPSRMVTRKRSGVGAGL